MATIDHTDTLPSGGLLEELRRGFRRQSGVVFALIFKGFRSRARVGRFGLLWVIFDPVSKIVVMSTIWYLAGRLEIGGVDVRLFVATGVIPYVIIIGGFKNIAGAMFQDMAYYSYPQVKPFDSMLAQFILEMALLSIGSVIIFFGLDWLFGLEANYYHVGQYLMMIFLAMALCLGLALINGTYRILFEGYSKILGLMPRPLLFTSALFFTLNDLPAEARYYLSFNPIVHILEYGRYYLLGIRLFPEASLAYPIGFTLVTLFFGFVVYYANRFKILMR